MLRQINTPSLHHVYGPGPHNSHNSHASDTAAANLSREEKVLTLRLIYDKMMVDRVHRIYSCLSLRL